MQLRAVRCHGMKINEDKCHLMIFGGKSDEVSVKIGEANVKESKGDKLLIFKG